MSNCSIWPIDRTLSDTTSPGQSGPGSDGNKHSPTLHHYWNLTMRLFGVIYRTIVVLGSYPSAEMQSVYSTAPADWATRRSLGESYPSAETQSVYSTALADWATRPSLGESYPSAETQSVYSIAPADWATRHPWGVLPFCREAVDVFYSPRGLSHKTLVGGVLPFCREAVGVFYSPGRLSHKSPVGESYPFAEMQSVYFIALIRLGQYDCFIICINLLILNSSIDFLSNQQVIKEG